MTIIVYRDGVLAADRMAVDYYGATTGLAQKIWRRVDDGALVGAAGRMGDLASFAAWFLCGGDSAGVWEAKEKKQFAGIVVEPGGVRIFDGDGRGYRVEAPFLARGAGSEFAMGAMEMGAGPVRAVEVACKYCIYCGGGVQFERVDW